MIPKIFLLIEKGDPSEKKTTLYLAKDTILIGRTTIDYTPDVVFTNLLVSRRHALITFENNQFLLQDLGSKHGTELNDMVLLPNQTYPLRHGDTIILAKGAVAMIFNNPADMSVAETVDFTGIYSAKKSQSQQGLFINSYRREVLKDGEPVQLTGKDLELLLFLFENQYKAVSFNEIKAAIWPERSIDPTTGAPDVGKDEVIALVYRVRKRLGNYGTSIVALPRFGYMFES